MSRDDTGRATVRAVRTGEPLRIDGQLDEEIYQSVPPIDGFIQQEPRSGEPVTEPTHVWVLFDDTHLYVSARCWDSQPARWVRSGLLRDAQNITDSENFVVILDTFFDRRNGYYFQTNLMGAMRDIAFADEGIENPNWNPVWQVRTGQFEGGWSLEMEIPFKALRYSDVDAPVWGINFRRVVRWKNEVGYLTGVPRQYGLRSIFRVSSAGTLVGLETPARSLNVEVKPYAISALTTDRAASVPYSNRLMKEVGIDFKYGITRSLTADFTYNSDFAQVEEDLQQVNLTRLNLFFPEKREFFLEGQGIFAFGGAPAGGPSNADVPILFFSRRIGLSQGQSVPVIGGARITGTAGRFEVGALNILTDDHPTAAAEQTNFAVVRVKRAILRQSYIGVLAGHRSPVARADNLTVGADARFALSPALTLSSYYARTRSPQLRGGESSYRTRFEYASDRYGLLAEQVKVGDAFNPEIGFIARSDFRRTSAHLRFSPRPRSRGAIRQFIWQGGLDYVTDAAGTMLQTRQAQGSFGIDLENGDHWLLEYARSSERLNAPLRVVSAAVIPVGEYQFESARTTYTLGQQRKVSGRLTVGSGSFYGGRRTEAGYAAGRLRLSPHFEVEPSLAMNWLSLPQGDFTSRLAAVRTSVMPSVRMVLSALLQYNSSTSSLNSSFRLRWEYTSGSELFVVYSDGRATTARGFPDLANRTIALKITRLLRF